MTQFQKNSKFCKMAYMVQKENGTSQQPSQKPLSQTSTPLTGHHGIKKTLIQIKNRFIIDKSHRTNTEIVNNCTICQQFKIIPQTIGKAETGKIRAHRPFEILCADLAGPYYQEKKKTLDTHPSRQVYKIKITKNKKKTSLQNKTTKTHT